MNIHPADGVASFEDNYKEMAEYMHHTPSKYAIDTIPYEGSNKNFMTGWLIYMLEPREKQGINFWWLDWQQALNDGNLKGLSTTYWINYVVFSNMERKGQDRPMLYHRWGGLGNHRYQIGFSGDVVISWESLKLQPYFTATASNVLYGFWSHDLGGHYNFNLSSYDHEIYLRWLQCGVYNPIFRIHSTKQAILNKEPWVLNDKEQPIMFDLIHKRYALDPYIYTSARESHNTGVSMCRPMYYDYPEDKQSYEYRSTEYMFGDQILVKPITDPLNGAKYSKINIWLPEGNDWYELSSGTMLKGGQTVERQFSLSEFPDYVKAGAIIPMYDNDIKNLQDVKNNEITVNVYPGGKGNHFDLYEDNGNDVKYESNYATTPISTKIDGNTTTVTIGARTGSYTDMPSNRQYKVKFNCVAPPTEVTVNGAKVDYEYVGNDLAAVITVPETSCAAEKVIKVTFPSNAPNLTCGYISRFHRIIPAIVAFKHINSGVVVKDDFGLLESAGRRVSYFPEQFNDVINKFKSDYNNMKAVMTDNGGIDNEQILWFQREINWETIK
jgi:alpha-glucosidase (family GH31 glycosyl hydrolase)